MQLVCIAGYFLNFSFKHNVGRTDPVLLSYTPPLDHIHFQKGLSGEDVEDRSARRRLVRYIDPK